MQDDQLTKKTRPLLVWSIFLTFVGFAIASGFDFNIKEAYVELLGYWGTIALTVYISGRTAEKISKIKSDGTKETKLKVKDES